MYRLFIIHVLEFILKLMHSVVPSGMKVYALAIIGILTAVALFALGDYATGGFLMWMSLVTIAGRHTAEKLEKDIRESGVASGNVFPVGKD